MNPAWCGACCPGHYFIFNPWHISCRDSACDLPTTHISPLPFLQNSFFGGGDVGRQTGVWIEGFALAKQALYHLSHTSSLFCSGYFGDGILRTICPGWPQTTILPISQIARITGVSQWHRLPYRIFLSFFRCSAMPSYRRVIFMSLSKQFLKSGPQTCSTTITWNLLEMW
jgi:hypothetical protein